MKARTVIKDKNGKLATLGDSYSRPWKSFQNMAKPKGKPDKVFYFEQLYEKVEVIWVMRYTGL